jgi:PilZ domain
MAKQAAEARLRDPETERIERRQWSRLPISFPVFMRGVDERGKEFLDFATALNIGAGGVLLASRRYLPLLSGVSLEMPCAPLPAPAELPDSVRTMEARLVRVEPTSHFHLLGLEFHNPLV